MFSLKAYAAEGAIVTRCLLLILGILLPVLTAVGAAPSVWEQAIRDGNLQAIAQRMRAPGSKPWPPIPSVESTRALPTASRAATDARRQMALALFDKIEAVEWQRQRIDDATESALITDYATIAHTCRAAGGYHNHVIADTCTRLALVRLGRWAIDQPARAPEAQKLLSTLQLPALSAKILDSLVVEQGGFPDRRSTRPGPDKSGRDWGLPARYPPTTRPGQGPMWTDPAKLSRHEYRTAVAALSGQPDGTAISLTDSDQHASRTRELLQRTDAKLLLVRLYETDWIAASGAPLLLEFLAKGGSFEPGKGAQYNAIMKREFRLKEERFENFPVGESDAQDWWKTLRNWPSTPVSFYVTAVDSAPGKAPNGSATLRLTEKPLGELPPKTRAAFAPDGSQFAYARGNVVLVNGRPMQGRWDEVHWVMYSPVGQLVFSTRRGKNMYVVVDGKAGPASDAMASAVFDPTGRHMAYIIRRGTQAYVVVDDKEFGAYNGAGVVTFSPTGQHHAWMTYGASADGLVVDGKHTGPLARPITQLTFSPDGQRLAYLLKNEEGTEDAVVTGATPLRVKGPVLSFAFSPTGQFFCLRALPSWKCEVSVEGNAIREMKRPAQLLARFSADGSRVFFGEELFGSSGKDLRPTSVKPTDDYMVWFDPAGRAKDVIGVRTGLVGASYLLNDRWTRSYDEPREHRFLPGGRFAFIASGQRPARSGPVPILFVVDGFESPEYSNINLPTLTESADGKHILFAAQRNGVWRINLDGTESAETFDDVPATGAASMSPNTFRLIARRRDTILSVTVAPR